jgi:predicted enzyme related to lactoylglutathione lyase
MSVTVNLESVILFVKDVEKLKSFYHTAFNMAVLEDHGPEWALLKTGGADIFLHRIVGDHPTNTASNSNVKIVFSITNNIEEVRDNLLKQGAMMQSVKRFPGYKYWVCDGEDPEGNMFQLKQQK